MKGLRFVFQGTMNAKNLRKNSCSPSDGWASVFRRRAIAPSSSSLVPSLIPFILFANFHSLSLSPPTFFSLLILHFLFASYITFFILSFLTFPSLPFPCLHLSFSFYSCPLFIIFLSSSLFLPSLPFSLHFSLFFSIPFPFSSFFFSLPFPFASF